MKKVLAVLFLGIGIGAALLLNTRLFTVARDSLIVFERESAGKTAIEIIDAFRYAVRTPSPFTTDIQSEFADFVMRGVTQGRFGPLDAFLMLSEGIAATEEVRKKRPQDAKNEILLGRLYTLRYGYTGDERDRDEAFAAYRSVLLRAPDYPFVAIGLAEIHLASGDPESAKEITEALYAKMKPSNVLFYTVLQVLVRAGFLDDAAEHVERFLQYPQGDIFHLGAEEMASLAEEALAVPDPAGRERFLEAILQGLNLGQEDNAQHFARIFFALASTKAELGKDAQAETYMQLAVEADPRYKEQINERIE